jgi:hypothetical protein
MKANDLAKAAAISMMATKTPSLEGYLGKLPTQGSFRHRDFQDRYFVLSMHYLAYYASKPSQLEDEPKAVYDMRGATASLSVHDDEDKAQASFEIVFPHDSEQVAIELTSPGRKGSNSISLESKVANTTLKLRGRSAENAQLWVNAINSCAASAPKVGESGDAPINPNDADTDAHGNDKGGSGSGDDGSVTMQGYLRQKSQTQEWEKFYFELHHVHAKTRFELRCFSDAFVRCLPQYSYFS